LIDEFLSAGAEVKAFDPEAMKNVKDIYGNKVSFVENQYEALEGADFLVIATEWNVFRSPDFNKIKESLKDEFDF
jgi:UDPglucose 6-dehydrogenase